jgi:hypothetical protein
MVKEEPIWVWKSQCREPPLEPGMYYRVDVDGYIVNITPISDQCIKSFQE